jgi:TRAP-type uncharacterized transport system substrate-binding protein
MGPLAASIASGLALVAGLADFGAGARAETMVRYAHPVKHNGRLVLYHGAWRDHAGAARDRKAKAGSDDASDEDATPAKPAHASSHEFIVLVDTDDPTSLRMATELVNAAKAAGLKARAWAGKTSPTAIADFVKRDGGDFAFAALDALAADPGAADLRAKAPLVAQLANEPIVVIARESVDDVKKLDGRPVSFGAAGGVVDASGQALFAKLGVAPKIVHENVAASLTALAAGKIDALVMFGADESRSVNQAAKSGKLHALALPWRADLMGGYAPARLTAKDLPGLTPAGGTVETVSLPFGLIAIDAADGSDRASQDAPFVAALFERFKPLMGANADPKWREVNLTAESDWPRLASARQWIEKRRAADDPALEAFRQAAKSASNNPSTNASAIADKLYNGLLGPGGAQP